MDKHSISIVIPVYNEQIGIHFLLDCLDKIDGSCEIIFVDGGSTDQTVEIIDKRYTVVCSPKKGRANQMNYGASTAQGNILFFLHADSLPPFDVLDHIYQILNQGYKAGCFRIRFDSKNPLMWICGFLSNLRVKMRNIAFGDQGIFLEKDYFEKLGGFCPIPLMEDYQLSIDIKKDGQNIGLASGTLITSERRFQKNGRLKTMLLMQKLQYMFRKGASIQEIAEQYNK